MPASTEITRLVLRKLAADAVSNQTTLLAALQSTAFGTVTPALSGKILVETQSGGTLSRWELPAGAGALQPQEVSWLLSRLLDAYDAAVTAISGTPTDAQVLAQMLGQLYPVRSYGVDCTEVRFR